MKIVYRQKKTISKMYENFMWKYEELFFAGGWIVLMILFTVGIVFTCVYMSRDITKPDEIKNIKKTTIMVKKKNGLWDGYIINSNGDIKVEEMPLRKDVLKIIEKGKNGIGIEIDMETTIENVDSFFVEKEN